MKIPMALLRETCTHYAYGGHSATGPTFGSGATLRCLVEPGAHKRLTASGQEVVAQALAIFAPSATLASGDKITFDGQDYQAIEVQDIRIAGQTHHWEVYLRSTTAGA